MQFQGHTSKLQEHGCETLSHWGARASQCWSAPQKLSQHPDEILMFLYSYAHSISQWVSPSFPRGAPCSCRDTPLSPRAHPAAQGHTFSTRGPPCSSRAHLQGHTFSSMVYTFSTRGTPSSSGGTSCSFRGTSCSSTWHTFSTSGKPCTSRGTSSVTYFQPQWHTLAPWAHPAFSGAHPQYQMHT